MRKNRTTAEWQSLIDEFEQSQLSQAEFCAQRGINAKYFVSANPTTRLHRFRI